jgi:hypothetical protein
VPSRLSPTDKIRAEIDALFGSGRDLAEVLEDVARLGARLIMQTALEAEVEEFLGRARYQRREQAPEARAGSRNGFCPTTVKSTAGAVTLDRPKLRGTDEAFCSRLFGTGVSKTNALETLVIAGFVRGLSVRDVEACLADALGPAGGPVQVDRFPGVPSDPRRVRHLAHPPLGRGGSGLPVRGRLTLRDAPRRPPRTGAGRVGHHHRGQAGPGRL